MPIANQAKETGVKYWQRLSQDWRREKTILRYWAQKNDNKPRPKYLTLTKVLLVRLSRKNIVNGNKINITKPWA